MFNFLNLFAILAVAQACNKNIENPTTTTATTPTTTTTIKPSTTYTTTTSAKSQPQSDQFVLSSTGPASRYQGHGLGMYNYHSEEEYYEQEGGDYYLKQERDGMWYTFPRISGCDPDSSSSCLASWIANYKTEDIELAGDSWSYAKDTVWTSNDSTIQFSPLVSSSCLLCSTILLTSTGPASKAKSEYFGTFKKLPLTFSAGRPVYKNTDGKYLMMKNEYTTFSVWDDSDRTVRAGKGEDDGTRGLRSLAGPTCVTDTVESEVLGWQFVNREGGWVGDMTVSVSCQE